jgi:hypothetical protein
MIADRPRSVWLAVGRVARLAFDLWVEAGRERRQRVARERQRRALVRGLDRLCRSLAARQGWETRRNRELVAQLDRISRKNLVSSRRTQKTSSPRMGRTSSLW